MLTTANNDILFDDLAFIGSRSASNRSGDTAIMYGDCGNRYEPETTELPTPSVNASITDKLVDLDTIHFYLK